MPPARAQIATIAVPAFGEHAGTHQLIEFHLDRSRCHPGRPNQFAEVELPVRVEMGSRQNRHPGSGTKKVHE